MPVLKKYLFFYIISFPVNALNTKLLLLPSSNMIHYWSSHYMLGLWLLSKIDELLFKCNEKGIILVLEKGHLQTENPILPYTQ